MKKLAAIILIITMITALAACGSSSQLIAPGTSVEQTGTQSGVPEDSDIKAADFAVRLLKACNQSGKNTLISPLSVMTALTMTANGAGGETLREMEEVLGMPLGELDEYIRNYMNSLPSGEKYRLDPANSIWFTSDKRFTVNEDFLKKNIAGFGADIYKAPFDDSTLKDINNWVKDKTEGMIPEILDQIPEEAVMYLINALAFEAEWQETYFDVQVHEEEFTAEDGTKEKAELMHSEEHAYLESENATGVVKYYKDGKYAFAALLPKEGITVDELVAGLDGEELNRILTGRKDTTVYTAIPKFETDFDIEMSGVLKTMGMPLAFDPEKADFKALGESEEGNISISRVIHKTFMSVGEQGTKAGAATLVEMVDEAALLEEEPKEVLLNRPFVYMLVDCETWTPFFIGTMMHVNEE